MLGTTNQPLPQPEMRLQIMAETSLCHAHACVQSQSKPTETPVILGFDHQNNSIIYQLNGKTLSIPATEAWHLIQQAYPDQSSQAAFRLGVSVGGVS